MKKKTQIIENNKVIIENKTFDIEELRRKYEEENWTVEQLSNFLSLSQSQTVRFLKECGIHKKQDFSQKITEKNPEYFVLNGQQYSKEFLQQKYLIENLRISELCILLNISKIMLNRLLNYYHITKGQELRQITREQTCLEKYGSSNFLQTEEGKNKVKEVMLQRYGVESPMSIPEVQQKRKQTLMEHFGVENLSYSQECLDKKKKTCLNKYGVEYTLQSPEIREQIKQTCLEKYGHTCSVQGNEIKNKSKETCFKKYGVEYSCQAEEVKEKIKKTNFERYGTSCSLHNKSIQQKIKDNCKKKYGCEYPAQKQIKNFNIWNDKNEFKKYLNSLYEKPTLFDLSEYFNVDETSVSRQVKNFNLTDQIIWKPARSHYENEIICWLQSQNKDIIIQRNVRNILSSKKEIDIYLPEYNLGIEFNGNYWHSDLIPTYQDHNGRSIVHQQKSLECETKGIFLFHIFEYEWNNVNIQQNIKNRLSTLLKNNTHVIYARQCEIKEIDKQQKKQFLNSNHIQGNDHSNFYLGLFYNDELVSCMTFNRSKYKKYDYELSRFCSVHDTNVIGGASKLFNYFVINILRQNETIVSYNDITKTKGGIYKILGFENISINSPNYIWMNFETGDIRTRYQEQAAGEVKRMHAKGYHRICDCGTKTWLYIKK